MMKKFIVTSARASAFALYEVFKQINLIFAAPFISLYYTNAILINSTSCYFYS